MEETKEKQLLQWHMGFFAGIQIELADYGKYLEFENEHQIGKKPKSIDVLIIKKDIDRPINKNIGKIFRKYNILEYKSPTDYLSINDFYKVYGYACFFKSDTIKADEIKIEELTITFVCHKYPKKLLKHLKRHGYPIECIERGIYYIKDEKLPIQLILTSRLSEKENMWLKSLTNTLKDKDAARKLLTEYEKHKTDSRYEAVMDLVVRANKELFQEVNRMCQALYEIFEEEMWDRFTAMAEEKAKVMAEEKAKVMAEEKAKVMAEERAKVIAEEKVEIIAQEKAEIIAQEKLEAILKDRVSSMMEEKDKVIVRNMLNRGMSAEDICALAECDLAFVNKVRLSLA